MTETDKKSSFCDPLGWAERVFLFMVMLGAIDVNRC